MTYFKTAASALALCLFVNISSANFIDPSMPTPADERSEAALAFAGQLVLSFFDHYFIKHQAIDQDTLEFTIFRFEPRKYADDNDFDKIVMAYFRVILHEVSGNMSLAKSKEERREVYEKTKSWLKARVPNVDLKGLDNPPTISKVNTVLPGTNAEYSYYEPHSVK